MIPLTRFQAVFASLAISGVALLLAGTPARAQITVNVPGFDVTVFSTGGLINQPYGLRFDAAGNLLVANTSSALGPPAAGNILSIDASGAQVVFSSSSQILGPVDIAISPGGAFGSGDVYFGIEDANPDAVFRAAASGGVPGAFATGSPVTLFYEHQAIRFGPGGGFGTDLYAVSRTGATGPLRVFRINSGGSTSFFTLMDGPAEVTGALGVEFAPGGGFGNDLYVSTFADPLSPGSAAGIYRTDSAGTASQFVAGTNSFMLAFSPDPVGPFGEYVYAPQGASGALLRIDPAGNVETFATSTGRLDGIDFSQNGDLYLSDLSAGTIYVISPTPPQVPALSIPGLVGLALALAGLGWTHLRLRFREPTTLSFVEYSTRGRVPVPGRFQSPLRGLGRRMPAGAPAVGTESDLGLDGDRTGPG